MNVQPPPHPTLDAVLSLDTEAGKSTWHQGPKLHGAQSTRPEVLVRRWCVIQLQLSYNTIIFLSLKCRKKMYTHFVISGTLTIMVS